MIIKRISHRRKFITAVYVEGKEEPYLFDSTVVKTQNLTEKTEICEQEVVRLSRLSQMNRAKERALRLIEFRSHSKKELFDKLSREFDGESAEFAVSQMLRLGLLDDLEFARTKTRFFVEIKKYSPARIRRELKLKGIEEDIIQKALGEYEIDPKEQIKKIIDKRFTPVPQDEKGKRRMINYLLRQGYSYTEIFKAAEEITE